MKKYSEILTLAKAEFKDESNWNKDGLFFRDARIFLNDITKIAESKCHCGMGAAIKVSAADFLITGNSTGLSENFYVFTDWVNNKVGRLTNQRINSFYIFNDDLNTTFTDLHNMFDKLIEAAKAEGI